MKCSKGTTMMDRQLTTDTRWWLHKACRRRWCSRCRLVLYIGGHPGGKKSLVTEGEILLAGSLRQCPKLVQVLWLVCYQKGDSKDKSIITNPCPETTLRRHHLDALTHYIQRSTQECTPYNIIHRLDLSELQKRCLMSHARYAIYRVTSNPR